MGQANIKNLISLARKAMYWRNRAEQTTSNKEEPATDEGKGSNSGECLKANFFMEPKEAEKKVSSPSLTPKK